MADRIAVMDHGRIVQVATPGEIYEQPKTRFIAEFVGDVNILEGEVVGRENGLWRVATPSARGAARRSTIPTRSCTPASAVAVAVRPEKMVLHRDAPAGGAERRSPARSGTSAISATGRSTGSSSTAARSGASPAPTPRRFVERPIGWDERVYTHLRARRGRDPHRNEAAARDRCATARRGARPGACRSCGSPPCSCCPSLIVLKISLSDAGDRAAALHAPVRRGADVGERSSPGSTSRTSRCSSATSSTSRPPLSSLRIAAISTLLLLLVGFPDRLRHGARAGRSWRPLLVALVILPFWTSFLIRIYAWIGILKPEGLLNQALLGARPDRGAARRSSTPRPPSSSASSTPTCRSWCCRSTRRWRGSTRR